MEHEKRTLIKYVNQIVIGRHTIDTWYYSPYPGFHGTREQLFICEYCLVYFSHPQALLRHNCGRRQPEGREIYRRGNISIYELDGLFHKFVVIKIIKYYCLLYKNYIVILLLSLNQQFFISCMIKQKFYKISLNYIFK